MLVKKTISKEEINDLPLKQFEGEIVVIDKLEDVKPVTDYLARHKVIGIDTETRPNFVKGQRNDVALLQLATSQQGFLFRLNKIGLPEELCRLLENPNVVKVGIALLDDLRDLNRLTKLEPKGMTDLRKIAELLEFEVSGARNLAGLLCGFRISKSQQLSNWENDELNEAQLRYAATDAWVCVQIFKEMQKHIG